MINLCDQNKYFTDKTASSEANRIPRSVEDIEVLGLIPSNENLNFPNSCDFHQISSLRLSFLNSDSSFTINGNGALDPENPRQPTEEEIEKITEENPPRAEHGWYSINPSYSIDVLSTNNTVILNNIGFNNQQIECVKLEINNSAIADNNLFISDIEFLENSVAYGCQLQCNTLTSNGLKSDNMVFNISQTGTFDDSSFLDNVFFIENLLSNNNKYIENSLNITSGLSTNDKYYKCNILNFNNSNLNFNNVDIYESSINSDFVSFINECLVSGSSFQVFSLRTSNTPLITKQSNLNIQNIEYANINNIQSSTIVNIVSGLNLINTSGSFRIENIGPLLLSSIIKNFSGSLFYINSGQLYNGENYGNINGNFLEIKENFTNYGEITTEQCLVDGATNLGLINTADLINSSVNSGIIQNASFFNSSANLGLVGAATFYDNSINDGQTDCDRSFSLIFKDFSINKTNIVCDNASYNFYNNSSSLVSYIKKASFYDNSRLDVPADTEETVAVENISLFDNATFGNILMSSNIPDPKVELNDFANGNIIGLPSVCSGLRIDILNNSVVNSISGSITGLNSIYNISVKNSGKLNSSTGSFVVDCFDNSQCGNSTATVVLKNNSSATGTSYNELYMNNSSFSTMSSCSVNILIMKDNSVFFGNNITSGLIQNSAKLSNSSISFDMLIFDQRSSNTSSLIGNDLTFINGSSHASGVIQANNILFTSNSFNAGLINNSTAYFESNTSHRGSGSDHTLYFKNGSINRGYADTAYFYAGSSNLGRVTNGFFHPSVTATGIVEVFVLDPSLE
jgi:hypothetical protein